MSVIVYFFLLPAVLPFLVQASYQLSEHISTKFIELIRLALIPVSTITTTATVGSTNTSQTSSKKQEKQEKTRSEIFMLSFFNILTLPAPCIQASGISIKIYLNFLFHTSLWYLKRFYEGL